MAQANIVVVSGNMVADPEIKMVGDRTTASFAIAFQESKKDPQTGEYTRVPHYFEVDAWDGEARTAQKFGKGKHCTVYGRLRQRKWQAQDGSSREKVSIMADKIIGDSMFNRLDEAAAPPPAQPRQRPASADADIPFGDEPPPRTIPVQQAVEQEMQRRSPVPAATTDIDDDIPW